MRRPDHGNSGASTSAPFLAQSLGQALDPAGRRAALAVQQHDAIARETLVLRMHGRCRQGRQHRSKDHQSDGKAQPNPANQWRKSVVSGEFVTPGGPKTQVKLWAEIHFPGNREICRELPARKQLTPQVRLDFWGFFANSRCKRTGNYFGFSGKIGRRVEADRARSRSPSKGDRGIWACCRSRTSIDHSQKSIGP